MLRPALSSEPYYPIRRIHQRALEILPELLSALLPLGDEIIVADRIAWEGRPPNRLIRTRVMLDNGHWEDGKREEAAATW